MKFAIATLALFVATAYSETVVTLPNVGIEMPAVLLGTGYMSGYLGKNVSETARVNIQSWLQAGGRGIDTALMYNDQTGIGQAIKNSGINRTELFVLTKVPGTNGYDKTTADVQSDLEQLGLDYLDTVLLHWCGSSTHAPFTCTKSNIQSSWKALEELHASGKIRAIGISNFCSGNLDDLMETATVTPHIHQIERHPGLVQASIVEKCQKLGIAIQGYAPLGDPDRCGAGKELLEDPAVTKIASDLSISPSQVLLRWQVQQGFSVTPRVEKNNTAHMQSNLAVLSPTFANLTDAHIASLNAIKASAKCWPVGVCGL